VQASAPSHEGWTEPRLHMRAGRSIALTLALVAVGDAPISGMPAADAGARVAAGVAARVAVEPTSDSAAPARASPVAPRGNPLWAIPLSDLSATGERPIFFSLAPSAGAGCCRAGRG